MLGENMVGDRRGCVDKSADVASPLWKVDCDRGSTRLLRSDPVLGELSAIDFKGESNEVERLDADVCLERVDTEVV
jgi:hypothetical protein